MRVLPQFILWKKKLREEGYHVFLPALIDYRQHFRSAERASSAKRRENQRHFQKIRRSDAILVLNYPANGISNYIGGSTFAEIAVAFSLHKEIFLVNPIPNQSVFKEELKAWGVKRWDKLNSLLEKD